MMSGPTILCIWNIASLSSGECILSRKWFISDQTLWLIACNTTSSLDGFEVERIDLKIMEDSGFNALIIFNPITIRVGEAPNSILSLASVGPLVEETGITISIAKPYDPGVLTPV